MKQQGFTPAEINQLSAERKPVKVIFRKMAYDATILALFPSIPWSEGLVQSYASQGQHSGADYAFCILNSTHAKPSEYETLQRELEAMGYKLRVKRRR
jgi:hypothetical protein